MNNVDTRLLLAEAEALAEYYKSSVRSTIGTSLHNQALVFSKATERAIADLVRLADLGATIRVIESDMMGVPDMDSGTHLYFVRRDSCTCSAGKARLFCKHRIVRDLCESYVFGNLVRRV